MKEETKWAVHFVALVVLFSALMIGLGLTQTTNCWTKCDKYGFCQTTCF